MLIIGLFFGTWTVAKKNALCILESVPYMKDSSVHRFMQLYHSFCVFVGTMFSTTSPWAPFLKRFEKRASFPTFAPALGCGRCANWKGQLNASDSAIASHRIDICQLEALDITPQPTKNTTNLGKHHLRISWRSRDGQWLCTNAIRKLKIYGCFQIQGENPQNGWWK